MLERLKYLALGASLATAMGVSAAQAETVLNASIWVPPTHPVHAGMIKPWAEKVEAATNGNVRVNILPKAVAGPAQHFDVVREGQADLGFHVHGYNPGRFVLTKAAEFPFLGNSAETTSVAYWRIYEKYLAQHNEHEGVKVIGVFTHGPGTIFNNQRPIRALADLSGLKMRVGGGIANEVAQAVGVVPVLKPAPASHELLSQGIIDGAFFPLESMRSFKLQDLVTNVTQVPGGLYNVSFVMMMNLDKWNSLSKADQDAIMSVSGENWARMAGKAWDDYDAKALEEIEAAGSIEIETADRELVEAIRTATAGIEAAWYEEVAKLGVDGAAVMREMRAEIAKLEKN